MEEAPAVMRQLEHHVQFEVSELRDVATVQPEPAELPVLAHIWAWNQGLLLEPSTACIRFNQLGTEPQAMGALIG